MTGPARTLRSGICVGCWGGHGEECSTYTDPDAWCGCLCLLEEKAGLLSSVGAGPSNVAMDWLISLAFTAKLKDIFPQVAGMTPWWLG